MAQGGLSQQASAYHGTNEFGIQEELQKWGVPGADLQEGCGAVDVGCLALALPREQAETLVDGVNPRGVPARTAAPSHI